MKVSLFLLSGNSWVPPERNPGHGPCRSAPAWVSWRSWPPLPHGPRPRSPSRPRCRNERRWRGSGLEHQWMALVPMIGNERSLTDQPCRTDMFFAQTDRRLRCTPMTSGPGRLLWSASLGQYVAGGSPSRSTRTRCSGPAQLAYALDRQTGRWCGCWTSGPSDLPHRLRRRSGDGGDVERQARWPSSSTMP